MYESKHSEAYLLPRSDQLDNKYVVKEIQQCLKETIKVTKAFIISSCIGYFSETMILTNWILYARNLHNSSDNWITFLVFSIQILQIIGILITSIFSDKLGFDNCTVITSSLLLLSTLLQAISSHIVLFGIGILLRGFVMDDIEILSLGFIGKLLPYNQATVYTSLWYTYTTIVYASGIAVGGLISTVFSMQITFILICVVVSIRWIYINISIRNTQKTIESKQLSFTKYYQQQITQIVNKRNENSNNTSNHLESDLKNTMFPLCIERMKEGKQIPSHQTNTNNGDGLLHWIELLLNILQFSLLSAIGVVEIQFYMEYAKYNLNTPEVIATIQMTISCVTYSISCVLLSKFMDKLNRINKVEVYSFSIPYYILYFVVFIGMVYTDQENQYLNWIWWSMIGILSGILQMILELVILELQPKNDTGKINGIKTMFRYGMGAGIASLISAYWDFEQHILLWVIPGCCILFAMLSALLAIIIRLYRNYANVLLLSSEYIPLL